MQAMMRSTQPLFLALLGSLYVPVAQAGHMIGEPVDRALAVHISNGGLEHIGDAIEGFVPTSFPISDISGEVYCSEEDAEPLIYALDSLELQIAADDVAIVASENRLDITLYGTLGSTSSVFYVVGDCSVLTDLDEVCQLELPTTALSAHLGLEITEFAGVFDATVDDISVTISPISNPLEDCTLSSVIGTLLGQDESAIGNLLLSYLEPEMEDLGPTVEEAIEDALNSLNIDTELALGEIPLDLSIYPSRVEFGEAGVILGLGAVLGAKGTAECVDASQGSEFHDDPWPSLDETAGSSSLEYDAAVVVGKDFVDHMLWAIWATGLLCMDLEDLSGIELNTSLLETFFGDSYAELFPEAQPALISLRAPEPPHALFNHDDPPLAVAIEDLGISTISSLDARLSRIFRVGIDAEVGIGVDLSAEEITPELYLDPNDFTYWETHNDLLDEGFSEGFVDLVDMVLGMFLPDDLLSAYPLPDLMGVGIGAVFWIPSDDERWQGLYLLADSSEVEPIDLGGCSGGSLGCDGTDTGGSGIDLGDLGCDEKGSGCGGMGCDDKKGSSCDQGCEGSSCSAPGRARVPALFPWRLLLLLSLASVSVLRRRG